MMPQKSTPEPELEPESEPGSQSIWESEPEPQLDPEQKLEPEPEPQPRLRLQLAQPQPQPASVALEAEPASGQTQQPSVPPPAAVPPPSDGILTVKVIACSNLLPADTNGKSDPYVKLRLSGTKKQQQTKVQKATINPVFNEAIELPLLASAAQLDPSPSSVPGSYSLQLMVTAMDKDKGRRDDFLGDVCINLCAVFAEAEGGWTGSGAAAMHTHPRTFVLGDSAHQLNDDEKTILEQRRGASSSSSSTSGPAAGDAVEGQLNPYGTVQLLLSFRTIAAAGKSSGKGTTNGSSKRRSKGDNAKGKGNSQAAEEHEEEEEEEKLAVAIASATNDDDGPAAALAVAPSPLASVADGDADSTLDSVDQLEAELAMFTAEAPAEAPAAADATPAAVRVGQAESTQGKKKKRRKKKKTAPELKQN